MKTVVEEQEIQKARAEGSPAERKPRAEMKVLQVEPKAPVRADTKTEAYESCMELAAQFLPRG